WCLTLRTPYGQVSETFPKDEKPDVDPEWSTPSEVLDLIEARLDSYWISTRRTETKATIAEIRRHANEIDAAWLDQQIKQAEDRLRILRRKREALEEEQANAWPHLLPPPPRAWRVGHPAHADERGSRAALPGRRAGAVLERQVRAAAGVEGSHDEQVTTTGRMRRL